jgi:hypothetical protein
MNQPPAGALAASAEDLLDYLVDGGFAIASPTTLAPSSSISLFSTANPASFAAESLNNSTSIAFQRPFAGSLNNLTPLLTNASSRTRIDFDSDPTFQNAPSDCETFPPSKKRRTNPDEDRTSFETLPGSSIRADHSAFEDYSTNPAYSAVVVDGTIYGYVARLVPGACVTAANQTSRYQQFINFIPDGCLECTHRVHDLFRCEKAAGPLRDYHTVEQLACLNCGWLGHSVFGCPVSITRALIVWHYSPPQLGQERYPPKTGVVELAIDLKPGLYDIPFTLWRQLVHNQVSSPPVIKQ